MGKSSGTLRNFIMDMELYGTLRILRFHTDLRVVDRIRCVGYAEDSLQWITDNAN